LKDASDETKQNYLMLEKKCDNWVNDKLTKEESDEMVEILSKYQLIEKDKKLSKSYKKNLCNLISDAISTLHLLKENPEEASEEIMENVLDKYVKSESKNIESNSKKNNFGKDGEFVKKIVLKIDALPADKRKSKPKNIEDFGKTLNLSKSEIETLKQYMKSSGEIISEVEKEKKDLNTSIKKSNEKQKSSSWFSWETLKSVAGKVHNWAKDVFNSFKSLFTTKNIAILAGTGIVLAALYLNYDYALQQLKTQNTAQEKQLYYAMESNPITNKITPTVKVAENITPENVKQTNETTLALNQQELNNKLISDLGEKVIGSATFLLGAWLFLM
jgi:hypothetical protein